MRSEAQAKKAGRTLISRVLSVACALVFCAIIGSVTQAQDVAQAPPPPPPDAGFGRMGHGPMPPDAMEFIGFQEGLGEKTVTGAPFSATITTSSKQTLADGNEIDHTSSGSIARDSQGRTRRDLTVPAFGPLGEKGKPAPHVVAISDPVAGSRYLLDADNKTARKMPVARGGRGPEDASSERKRTSSPDSSETVTTSLGTQMIGGVSAEGTRYTRTIPAGQIGNAKPIVIVTERWFSPDLQMVVMTKRSDPRMGETTFQLTNIVRQEPAASLFQVPADYAVTQAGSHDGHRSKMEPPPPAPAE